MINFVVRWTCVQIGRSMLYLYMYIHTHGSGHRLRPEWEIKLEGFLVVKNLDMGIRQAWDQMLALPLLADRSSVPPVDKSGSGSTRIPGQCSQRKTMELLLVNL